MSVSCFHNNKKAGEIKIYEQLSFEFLKKEKQPIWDYTRLDKAKLYQKMFQYPSFSRCFDAKYNMTEALIEELAVKTWGETHRVICMSGETGCQPKGSKVLMANGEWKNIENIQVNDEIISPQKNGKNKFSKVLNITKWICNENYDVYRQHRDKKLLYSCSYNHIIPMYRYNSKFEKGKRKWELKEKTAQYYFKITDYQKNHRHIGFSTFAIPKFKNRQNCKIEPYTLGVYLGDGCSGDYMNFRNKKTRYLAITNSTFEIMQEVSKFYSVLRISQKKNTFAKSYNFSVNSNLFKLLTKYNLINKKSGNKFIPKEALLSDIEYRKRLFAGLIDTDGYYSNGGYSITSKSKQLIEDIIFLVYSLGGRCNKQKEVIKTIKSRNFRGKYYQVSFYLGNLELPLKVKYKKRDINTFYLASNRISILLKKNIEKKEVYGFTLDSKSGWYITDNFMITHNTGKSLASQMLAKMIAENTGVEFLLKNICFTFDDIIEKCRTIVKNSTIIADESVLQTGIGMIRERYDIMNIENVTRKFGLNILWVYPKANIEHSTAHFELETIGICKAERLTKLAIKQGNYYFGYAIINVEEALNDKMWIEYNKLKDEFIEDVLQRRVKRMNFNAYAQSLLEIPAFANIEKIGEMKAYARSCDEIVPSNITEQELNQIINSVIRIKKDREYQQNYQESERNSQFDEAIAKSLKEQYSFIG